MKFPSSEPGIIALCISMIAGLIANSDIYDGPPFTAEELQTKLDALNAARDERTQAEAASIQSTAAKDAAKEDLVNAMKLVLRYAEQKVDFDGVLLQRIGWDAHSEATPLPAPEQPRVLEILSEGPEGEIAVDWKRPLSGVKPAGYELERRILPQGNWETVGFSFITEAQLENQPRGVDLEYRAIATNPAGKSTPSNIVSAVL